MRAVLGDRTLYLQLGQRIVLGHPEDSYEIRHDLAGETYHFVNRLKNDPDFENYDFSFIIGLDNANSFHSWVNADQLERMIRFVVAPRQGEVRDDRVNWW